MDTSWMDDANCIGRDVNDFFDGYLQFEDIAIEVNSICGECLCRNYCLNFGIATKSTGIWGGRWLSSGKIIKEKELMSQEYFDG